MKNMRRLLLIVSVLMFVVRIHAETHSVVCARDISDADFTTLASCHAHLSKIMRDALAQRVEEFLHNGGANASIEDFINLLQDEQASNMGNGPKDRLDLMIKILDDLQRSGFAYTVQDALSYLQQLNHWFQWHSEYGANLEDDF